jgi:peptidoglycan/xylan/chitin deacetylase (PgdA/CDA1 family)
VTPQPSAAHNAGRGEPSHFGLPLLHVPGRAKVMPRAEPAADDAEQVSDVPATVDGETHRYGQSTGAALTEARGKGQAMSSARIPILLYHSVSDEPHAAIAPFSVTPAVFEQQLDLIVQGGHCVLSVTELVDALAAGCMLPTNTVVITFDDGFADTLEVALPKLSTRSLTATVYLTTGYLSGKGRQHYPTMPGRMLSWRQIPELENAGLEIGAHAETHRQLDILPLALAREEVHRSKELLETALDHSIRSFAYPHGYANSVLRREVRAAGFDSACGVRNAISHPLDDRWQLARLVVRSNTPLERVASWLRGTGAPVAGPGETLQTSLWRQARRFGRRARNM